MHCRKRMNKPSAKDSQVHEPSKAGNGVSKKGDKHAMEYRPVKKDPEWDGKQTVAKWGA